jgi:hypothetical protein
MLCTTGSLDVIPVKWKLAPAVAGRVYVWEELEWMVGKEDIVVVVEMMVIERA